MSVEPPKKLDQKKKNIQKEENFDAEIIDNEIDLWEKKNLKKLESQISTHHKSKSYSFKILENPIHTTNKLKLPSLIQDEKLDFEKKYSPNQEEIFKNFKNEIYLDGTFRKLITNYTKFSLDCNENHDFSEYSINAENIEDLMKEIQFFFTIRLDEQWSTIIEKTNFFESNRNYIDKKIQTKIRNSEVFINNKQLNSILFRKENIVIIEKMSKIKNLV